MPVEQLGMAIADHRALAGEQIAEAERVQAVARLFQQAGGVAFVHGFFVAPAGSLLAHGDAGQLAVADLEIKAEQHGVVRYGEGVHGLDIAVAGVLVGLLHAELEQQPCESPPGSHAPQGYGLATV